MRVGILGAGVIGKTHAKIVTELPDDVELAAIADSNPGRAPEVAAGYGCAALTSIADLVGRSDVDIVSVCVPSGLHADAAVAALDAGKHVIIEKPIDITLDAADRIIAAEQRSGRRVTVISQRRFQPGPMLMHDLVTSGELGRVTSGLSESTFWRSQGYYDSGEWRGTWALDGGGALMNQGVHAADLLVWLLGEPVEVIALADTLAHERVEVEDTLSATVRFDTGALGTITATTASYPGRTVRILVNGDQGSALMENERLEFLHTAARAGDGDEPNHALAEPAAGTALGLHAAHTAQYTDFLAALREDRAPRVTTADGRRVLALILAIYESARTGGAKVRVSTPSLSAR
jgi:UDP-N-acetyl-2-amino-2-deoxyglucuronate dehydrogenase